MRLIVRLVMVMPFAHTGRKTYSGRTLSICIERGLPTVLIAKADTEFDLDALPDIVTVLHTTTQDPSVLHTISHTTAIIADRVAPGLLATLPGFPRR